MIGNILNIKLGYTTNSSSMHSILWVPGRKDKNPGGFTKYTDFWFGCGYRKVETLPDKRAYVVSQLFQALRPVEIGFRYENEQFEKHWKGVECSIDMATIDAISELIDLSKKEIAILKDAEPYIDNESCIGFPHMRGDEDKLNLQFVKEWVEWVLRPEVVIYTHREMPVAESNEHGERRVEFRLKDFYAFKDKDKNLWILYNPKTGERIMTKFDSDFNKFEEEDYSPGYYGTDFYDRYGYKFYAQKTSSPLLVDLNITEICGYGCPYCYQDSKTEGEMASLKSLKKIASMLKEAGTLEVAFSGGDPAGYPDVIKVAGLFNCVGITVNMATKNLEFITKNIEDLLYRFGAIAWSYDGNIESLKQYLSLRASESEKEETWAEIEGTKNRLMIHYVMGTESLDSFKEFIKICNENEAVVILLGFKGVGRGKDYRKHNYEGWIETLKKEKAFDNINVGVDTALLRECPEIMKISNPMNYNPHDGIFSCYMDAVKGTISENSYSGDTYPLPTTKEGLLDVFKKFGNETTFLKKT
jgi:MoaA/NifB/PqqE/SkfB family radical SAM enzyme